MTEEGLRLIMESAPYKNAGNIIAAWPRYQAANPAEAKRLTDYIDARIRGSNPAPPRVVTKFGLGVLALVVAEPQPEPTPTPPPIVSWWDQHQFAIIITAGNIDPQLLADAGVTAVAFADSAANRLEAQQAGWARFQRGVFFVTRATSADALKSEAKAFKDLLANPAVSFGVCDTENLKADAPNQHYFALQDVFYTELRTMTLARVANITYGWHQDPTVVNRQALRNNFVEPWWEAYNGDAASWDTRAVCEKLNAQGHKPARLCLGDKMLEAQVPQWKQLVSEGKAAKGTMLWAVDNGPAQESLRNGVKLT